MSRGVLTLASGPERFQQWAGYLQKSISRFDPGCQLAVVTDVPDSPYLRGFDQIIPFDPTRGEPYLQKLWLPEYSPFDETLFLDADCLVYRGLDHVWQSALAGPDVGVAARVVDKPYWCSDLALLPEEYLCSSYVEHNGGLMFWRRTGLASDTFAEARDVYANHYREFGLHLFGERPNDEPPLALVMSRRGLLGIQESRHTMRSLAGLVGQPRLRIGRGTAEFTVYEGEVVRPAVVHFTGPRARELHAIEIIALRLSLLGVPGPLADGLAPTVRAVRRRLTAR